MTQHTQIGHITALSRIEEDKYVRLDKFTVRSLELIGSMNDGGSSLLNVIDKNHQSDGCPYAETLDGVSSERREAY